MLDDDILRIPIRRNHLRKDIPAPPIRCANLEIDERGYPLPYFAGLFDGKRDHRIMDEERWVRCVKQKLCWVCGAKLGAYYAFILGPMCGITRTSSEPPSHRECAEWSLRGCPFLTRPHMERRQHDQIVVSGGIAAGYAIKRNPGCLLLWITRSYEVWKPEGGGYLITVGDPLEWSWWAEGRPATRAEIEESVRTGLPLLEEQADQQSAEALADLERSAARLREMYPA